ncbi:MAG: DUF3365 domain-containing protein, partial [Rhodospirillaceae bacterium]|nr:DUF3365 domain-containing protein [Rhodospirillaceae bacterium]
EARIMASRAVIKDFFGSLKGELVDALTNGGPVNAIGVCNTQAPAIADAHSKAKGWGIARTSLKLRNQANAPDEWETPVLNDFEARKAKGEDTSKMEFAEVVETGGKKEFRYMKAIPTDEKPCLACHGGNISEEVAAKLDDLYPQDKARGYNAGDIRGAFTIRQPM